MTAPELKPCPFCGGEAYTATGLKGDGSPWNYVECEVCAASAEPDEWNTRTAPTDFISRDDPVLRQVMEALEKEIKRSRRHLAKSTFDALAAMQELIGGKDG